MVKVTQLCLTLCNPMDYSPPGSSVHGISQGRVLEWVAIPISRESSDRLFTSRVTRETRRSWHLEVIGTIFSREASMEEG